jgi:hypothetical protein
VHPVVPVDPLDPALRARSVGERALVLTLADAHLALTTWESAGWAVVAWTRRYPMDGSLRRAASNWGPAWRKDEPWGAHVAETVAAARADLGRWALDHPDALVEFEAVGPSAHVAAAEAILARWFMDGRWCVVGESPGPLPLVAARLSRSTPGYSVGQRVYVYDVFWGMNERARVLGRHRRRHGWVHGVCPIDMLIDCRPRVVHTPAVLAAMRGRAIDAGCFRGRFWPMPSGIRVAAPSDAALGGGTSASHRRAGAAIRPATGTPRLSGSSGTA